MFSIGDGLTIIGIALMGLGLVWLLKDGFKNKNKSDDDPTKW